MRPKEKTPLTARQNEVFDIIADFIDRRHFAPTVREIMDELGVSSPNGIVGHLDALEAKGWIGREPNMARALWIQE